MSGGMQFIDFRLLQIWVPLVSLFRDGGVSSFNRSAVRHLFMLKFTHIEVCTVSHENVEPEFEKPVFFSCINLKCGLKLSTMYN